MKDPRQSRRPIQLNIPSGAALAVAVLFVGVSARGGEQVDKNCHSAQVASIDLVTMADGAPVLPVKVAGYSGFMFLTLRSGVSSLLEKVPEQLALPLEPENPRLPLDALRVTVPAALVLDGFDIGAVRLAVVPVNPWFKAPKVGDQSMMGTVGMNAFLSFDVELNLSAKNLKLYAVGQCTGAALFGDRPFTHVPVLFDELGSISFPVELNGKKLQATLSTGSIETTLLTDASRQVFGFDDQSPGMESEDELQGGSHLAYHAMTFSANGFGAMDTKIKLGVTPVRDCKLTAGFISTMLGYRNCVGLFPVSVGRNVLEHFDVYVATKERVLYLASAEPEGDKPPATNQ